MQARHGGLVLALGIFVAAVASGAPSPPTANVFVPEHAYGIGEQQVYAIVSTTTLTVKFRRLDGSLVKKTLNSPSRHSVALTVQGYTPEGAPVLAVATPPPAPARSGSKSAISSPSPAAAASGVSPPPGPSVRKSGAVETTGPLADLSITSVVLSGLNGAPPELGKSWRSSGTLQTSLGTLAVALDNAPNNSTGDETSTTLQVTSKGTADVTGDLRVPDFGKAVLRGRATVGALTYVELANRLLLGMDLVANGRGNLNGELGQRGSFDLAVRYAVKLVRYVRGASPAPSAGLPFSVASGFLGGATGETPNYFRPASINPIAQPGATNTGFLPPPQPVATISPTAAPGESLPPVPIVLPSGQPVASPPPAPSPSPTRYP